MRWADALNASPVSFAYRKFTSRSGDDDEPNIILKDPKFPNPKLFRAGDHDAWRRIPLKKADTYDDWQPCEKRLDNSAHFNEITWS